MIRVIFQDGQERDVDDCQLERLLATGAICRFQRQGKWVDPACDQIRRNPLKVLGLPERRADMLRLLASGESLPLNDRRGRSLSESENSRQR